MSTTMIEIEQSTAMLLQTLKERATAQGLSLDAMLRPLAEAAFGRQAEETSSPHHKENGLVSLHPNQLWLRAHRNDYRGQWVVLYQGDLVAHGTDGIAAAEMARSQEIPEPFIAFIPAEDNPFAGF